MITVDKNQRVEFGIKKESLSLAESMEKLFPEYWNENTKPIPLAVNEIKQALQTQNIDTTTVDSQKLDVMKTSDDVQTILQKMNGRDCKYLILELCQEKNIALISVILLKK